MCALPTCLSRICTFSESASTGRTVVSEATAIRCFDCVSRDRIHDFDSAAEMLPIAAFSLIAAANIFSKCALFDNVSLMVGNHVVLGGHLLASFLAVQI